MVSHFIPGRSGRGISLKLIVSHASRATEGPYVLLPSYSPAARRQYGRGGSGSAGGPVTCWPLPVIVPLASAVSQPKPHGPCSRRLISTAIGASTDCWAACLSSLGSP